MNNLSKVLNIMHSSGLINEANTISCIVKGSRDGFSLSDLKQAIDKFSSMSVNEIQDMLKESDNSLSDINVTTAKFIDSMYFNSVLKGITATYSIVYTKSEDESHIYKKLVYVTWDGQSFSARL